MAGSEARMKTARQFPKLLLAAATFVCALALYPRIASGQAPAPPQLNGAEQHLGVFTIGGQSFAVVVRSQNISAPGDAKPTTTLSDLAIFDANANVVYQESFAALIANNQSTERLSVSASMLNGSGGQALILRFLEESAAGGVTESWQMFGLVKGTLTRYGPPLPLGQGGGLAVNGVLTGVMLNGGIGVLPLASTAEALEFRAWTGNFLVYVPVRVDWTAAQWSEAEQCFALDNGSLRPNGCNLRIAANPRPPAEGTLAFYAQPQEDTYNSRQVSVHSNSAVEFLIARPLVNWKSSGDRFSCSFDDMWLRVRVDGVEGWVHSQTAFAALGLPSAVSPQ
jgi:hypothetical protein